MSVTEMPAAEDPTASPRAYRLRWTPVAVRITYPICVVFSGLLVWDYAVRGTPALSVLMAFVIAFAAIIVWGEMMGVRAGLYESEVGLTCRSPYGSYRVGWPDIDTGDHRKVGTKDRVYVHLIHGHWRVLPGVLQGQRVVWDGGETRDIVSVLTGRRDTWRAERQTSA